MIMSCRIPCGESSTTVHTPSFLIVLLFLCTVILFTFRFAEAQEKTEASSSLAVSKAHALFGKQCALCHEPFKGAPEQLCLKCHAGPIHNASQAVTPPCIACHVEHKGQEHLAQVANGQCVSCHADVKLKGNAAPLFAKKVTSFTADHPEFALSVKSGNGIKRIRLDAAGGRQADQTTLTFPHEVHLKTDLKSPKGPVQLLCKDCHAPADNGRQIAPIVYEKHCQSCHQLAFSPDMPNRFAPHAEPSVVHGFLVATYAERRSSPAPAAKSAPEPQLPTGRLTRPVPSVSPVITSPTAGQSVAAAEKYLYTVTCNKCHAIENPQARIPTIARVAIPQVWLPHALFPHRDHRALECIACHESVQTSKAARDVNLPSIQICQQCHRAKDGENAATAPRSATTDCVSCHVYHDKSKDANWLGTFSIQQILTEGDDPKGQAVQGTRK